MGRYGRYLLRGFVSKARTVDQPSFRSLLGQHLGAGAADLPVTLEQWPPYEHVNVQGALDVVLAEGDVTVEVYGVARRRPAPRVARLACRVTGFGLGATHPDGLQFPSLRKRHEAP